jgi:hypothetical protein
VDADDGVDGLDRLPAYVETGGTGAFGLCNTAVEGGKAFQVGLKSWAEGRVEGIAGDISVIVSLPSCSSSKLLTYPELHRVSPPCVGAVTTFNDVVLGGWISYVTSLCQRSSLEKADESGRRAASLYTTVKVVSVDSLH